MVANASEITNFMPVQSPSVDDGKMGGSGKRVRNLGSIQTMVLMGVMRDLFG